MNLYCKEGKEFTEGLRKFLDTWEEELTYRDQLTIAPPMNFLGICAEIEKDLLIFHEVHNNLKDVKELANLRANLDAPRDEQVPPVLMPVHCDCDEEIRESLLQDSTELVPTSRINLKTPLSLEDQLSKKPLRISGFSTSAEDPTIDTIQKF